MHIVLYLLKRVIGIFFILSLVAYSGHAMSKKQDALATNTDELESSSRQREGIVGRVIDASARPVVGASIIPESMDKPQKQIPEILIITDADGRYMWLSLAPGHYRFTVVIKGHKPVTLPAQVKRGALTTLDFILK